MPKSKKTSKTDRNPRNLVTCLAILNCIKAEINYLTQIAKQLKKSAQTIHYNLHVLEDRGYIRRVTGNRRSYPVLYELTDKAHIVLSNSERLARSGGVRFHHYALKYRVAVDNPSFLPVSEGVPLRGGVIEITGKVEGYTVRRWHAPSGDHLYLFSRHMVGDLPWQLLSFASIELDRLSRSIEQRFQMKLEYDGILQKPELSDARDPLAGFWGNHYGTVIRTETGSGIDASEGPWETEFSYADAVDHVQLGRNTAKVAVELPQVRALLEKILDIVRTQSTQEPTVSPPDSRLWV
jgi:DNA-binding MarR family transcriptional regulator